MYRTTAYALLLSLALIFSACSNNGLPGKDGQYPIQSHSLAYDGNQYHFYWADAAGTLHQAHGKDFKLLQDQRTYLQVQNRQGILHLQPNESVTVEGQDRNGSFTSSWFPFLIGAAIGNSFGGPRYPTYYYPPTDRFGRGDELHGGITTSAPRPPDYTTVQPPPDAVRPAPGAVAGQSSGTGGGNAATNKLGGSSGSSSQPAAGAAGSAPGAAAVSGQSGGTGSGSAVSDKGGFRSGNSSYSVHSGGSSTGSSSGGSSGSSGSKGLGGSSSGSKGISGAGGSRGSAPSRPSSGGGRH
ncbi:MAG: hypothetical protein ACR2PL_09335 [Dehalococcoidia bacterium]